MVLIGIDPGKDGAIAVIRDGTPRVYQMPIQESGELDAKEIYLILKESVRSEDHICVLEKVGAMPGQGVTSMFTFGRNVGELKAILKIAELSYIEVTPQAWKKEILAGLPWKAEGAADKKRAKMVSVSYVERRFPKLNIRGTKGAAKDGMADAVCLALYGGRK